MTSDDREILVTIYENQVYLLKELQGLKTELGAVESRLGTVESEQQAIRTELLAVHEEQRVLGVRLDDLQTSVYWALAIVGIFLAVFAIWLTRKEQPVQPPQREPERRDTPLIIQVPAYSPDPEIWMRRPHKNETA